MRNQKWIVLGLSLLMLLSSSMIVAAESSSDAETNAEGKMNVNKSHGRGILAPEAGIHHDTYLTLLVEKYAPNTLTQWETLLEERDQLVEELRAFALEKRNSLGQTDSDERPMIARKLRGHENNEQVTREEMVDQVREKMEKVREKAEPFSTSWSDLGEALKENNEDGIQQALEQLYAEYQEQNEQLQQKLDELQEQHAEPTE